VESAETRGLTVVGFTGKAGSGKDHMGRMLWRTHGFLPLAFGDAMKERLCQDENLFMTEMLDNKSEEMRTRLQKYGTEEHRARDPYMWVQALENRLWLLADKLRHHRFAITDVRFQNEADLVHGLGGFLFWLKGRSRELTEAQATHASENYDAIECDYVVDNSLSRSALAEEEVRRITMSWLVSNSKQE
jgi:hypothetical protein